ncbi:MAG: serine hydrolase domain-containing protein [Gammaproteobacteria bacterium]
MIDKLRALIPTLRALLLTLLLLPLSSPLYGDDSWPMHENGPAAAGFSQSAIAELDSVMAKLVADQDVAGIVWLLAKDGNIATFKSAGMASIEDNRPMTRDSLFRIYSMTKPVAGVALMMLWEQGLWDFDDPVSKFIPEFANLQVMTHYDNDGNMILEPMKRQPTMRELVSHSAGFGYGLSGNDPVNQRFRDLEVLNSADLDELVAKVATIPLLYQPGEQWVYSIAVDLQGYIVEKLSGQKFGDFLEQRIFQPLGMSDTRFFVKPEDRNRFADVYRWDTEHGRLARNQPRTDRPSYHDPDRLESGGGGLVSSTHDYARFLQMLVNGGELDGNRILSPEAIDIMRTNRLRDELNIYQTETSPGLAGRTFGFDFAIIEDPAAANTPQSAGSYYWSGAAGTWFYIDPVEDLFWIGMIQSQNGRRPGAADMRGIANDIIYADLAD